MTSRAATGGDVHTVTVERILPGGVGLARIEGRSVLLQGSVPGDTVEVALDGKRATLLRVVTPSPDRVVPVCADVDTCGGCDLMHLAYPAQLAAKRDMLEDCLRRIGKLTSWPEIRIIGSPAELAYRWRASFHVAADGSLGYMGRRSHRIVSIRRCHVLDPVLEEWRSTSRAGDLPVGSRVASMTNGEQVSGSAGGPAEELSVVIGQERYRAAADGFFQANGALVDRLVEEVVRMAAVHPDEHVQDLYAGAGLFTLPLARRAAGVTAVESDPRATSLLSRLLETAGIGNVEVRRRAVERSMERRMDRMRSQVIVLDPPRAGAGPDVVERITGLRPKRVVMVSCDPATFARDVKDVAGRGYGLRELSLLDMFPQTHHLEVVGLLMKV